MDALSAVPFGRQRPASLDAERSILGAIMLNNACYLEVAASLTADDFSLEAHRLIYAQMIELLGRGEPVDMITLVEELRRREQLKPSVTSVTCHR